MLLRDSVKLLRDNAECPKANSKCPKASVRLYRLFQVLVPKPFPVTLPHMALQ